MIRVRPFSAALHHVPTRQRRVNPAKPGGMGKGWLGQRSVRDAARRGGSRCAGGTRPAAPWRQRPCRIPHAAPAAVHGSTRAGGGTGSTGGRLGQGVRPCRGGDRARMGRGHGPHSVRHRLGHLVRRAMRYPSPTRMPLEHSRGFCRQTRMVSTVTAAVLGAVTGSGCWSRFTRPAPSGPAAANRRLRLGFGGGETWRIRIRLGVGRANHPGHGTCCTGHGIC
jgi:hypothetical protein